MYILVVEDDPKISTFVVDGLRHIGHTVDSTGDGQTADQMARASSYDVAVIDLMLPEKDGLTLIEDLRKTGVKMPIVVLSAKRSSADKVACLQSGADDYLSKPFDMAELVARVDAVVRRTADVSREEKIEISGVSLDRIGRTVRRDGQRIDLPPREFALLELLMRHVGQPLSKSYLLERLWDHNVEPQTNIVDVLICRLRNRIDRDFPEKLICTVRAVGYVFKPS
ncbi:response regulator transcription factor [soil metagenome]